MGKADRDHTGHREHRPGTAPAVRSEHWKNEPEEHDYPAAADYLSMVAGDDDVCRVVEALKSAPIAHRKAKDLLRASRLALLAPDDPNVAADLAKVRRGERLSPVLVVRGAMSSGVPLTVADGYHRICASYHLDENAEIPCRLVDAPALTAHVDGALAGHAGATQRDGPAPD